MKTFYHKITYKKQLILIATILFCLPLALTAHPHVSFDASIEVETNGNTCTGIWQNWTFDIVFSSQLIHDFDSNSNKKFEKDEIDMLYYNAFINLENYGYFTLLRQGNTRTPGSKAEKFSASISGDKVTYRFYMPLTGTTFTKDFHVAIFDTTYFCAIRYTSTAATIRQAGSAFGWGRSVNKSFPVYYNPSANASDNRVYESWKPGLETAWPEEIHIFIKE